MKIYKPLVWEQVPSNTTSVFKRAAIFGGWLVRSVTDGATLTFVPDSGHQWDLRQEYPVAEKEQLMNNENVFNWTDDLVLLFVQQQSKMTDQDHIDEFKKFNSL